MLRGYKSGSELLNGWGYQDSNLRRSLTLHHRPCTIFPTEVEILYVDIPPPLSDEG